MLLFRSLGQSHGSIGLGQIRVGQLRRVGDLGLPKASNSPKTKTSQVWYGSWTLSLWLLCVELGIWYPLISQPKLTRSTVSSQILKGSGSIQITFFRLKNDMIVIQKYEECRILYRYYKDLMEGLKIDSKYMRVVQPCMWTMRLNIYFFAVQKDRWEGSWILLRFADLGVKCFSHRREDRLWKDFAV